MGLKGIYSYDQKQTVKEWATANGYPRLTQKVADAYFAANGEFSKPRVFGKSNNKPILKLGPYEVGRGLWPSKDKEGNTYFTDIMLATNYNDGNTRYLSFRHGAAKAIGEALIQLANEPDPAIEIREALGV